MSSVNAKELEPTIDEPIVVDLDESLVLSDTLIESLLHLVRESPFTCLKLLLQLPLLSRAQFKSRIAQEVQLDPASLPYNRELLDYLEDRREQSQKIVLASASNEQVVQSVSDHLGIFDECFGSSDRINLKGKRKAEKLVETYGEGGFVYAGDSRSDIPVWKKASAAITIGNANRFVPSEKIEVRQHFPRKSKFGLLLKQLRVYQWIKNILVFVPIVTSGLIAELPLIVDASICFFAFSMTASSAYMLNDLLDIESDRQHPRKRFRPFASGDLPLHYGLVMAPGLLLLGLGVAALVDVYLSLTILGYFILTTWYSFHLKTLPLVDVFTLAGLYTLRVLGGGVATEIQPSVWLLSFSGCLFLSLAFLKRFVETDALNGDQINNSRRGYNKGETQIQMMMGTAAGFSAVIVFSIWLESAAFAETYSNQLLIWMVLPLILLWQCRLWLAAYRGNMHDDPIVYTAGDRVSWFIFGLSSIFYLLGLTI